MFSEKIKEIKLSPKDRIKKLKLPDELTPDLAYLCGVFIGDGSIYSRKEKNDYILKCVGNPKDEQEFYYEIVAPKFKKVFGFTPNIKLHDSNTTFGFAIYSKALFEFLTKIIGLPSGKKYATLKIPIEIKKDKELMKNCLKGIMDTDGSVAFKKRYKDKPYYPTISLSSKSKMLIKDVADELKQLGFLPVELYDYKSVDKRIKLGFTIINRIELNGVKNLEKWVSTVGFLSPKHLNKIKNWREK